MIGRMDDSNFLRQVGDMLVDAEGRAHIFLDQSLHPWECQVHKGYRFGMGHSAYTDFMHWLTSVGEDVQEAHKRGAAIGQN